MKITKQDLIDLIKEIKRERERETPTNTAAMDSIDPFAPRNNPMGGGYVQAGELEPEGEFPDPYPWHIDDIGPVDDSAEDITPIDLEWEQNQALRRELGVGNIVDPLPVRENKKVTLGLIKELVKEVRDIASELPPAERLPDHQARLRDLGNRAFDVDTGKVFSPRLSDLMRLAKTDPDAQAILDAVVERASNYWAWPDLTAKQLYSLAKTKHGGVPRHYDDWATVGKETKKDIPLQEKKSD